MRVFELFSGIGGMHFALKESGVEFEVVRALDINTVANDVYKHNFPGTHVLQCNVQSLSPKLFEDLGVDMITMSPPCQPYTRQGQKMGAEDRRNDGLTHIIRLLPQLTTIKYIFVENVVGFETSSPRDDLINALTEFTYQEFILSPSQFTIPNSRSRYYLLAKRGEFTFPRTLEIRHQLPGHEDNKPCFPIGDVIKGTGPLIPEDVLEKYGNVLDIVGKDSRRSCCFTKGYTRYAEGTGSVFCPGEDIKELRYFSPEEISRLMCFPEGFSFPRNVTERQRYRLLGNSVNVYVVSLLIQLLVK